MKILIKKIILFIILCAASSLGSAGPPFITNDPNPVDFKHYNIYLYTAYEQTPVTRDIAAPGIEVDYGLAPRLEFNITSFYDWHRNYTPVASNTSGASDVALGLKYALHIETKYLPQVAFAPIYYVATGSALKGIGNGRSWGVLPIWLQKTWKTWTCYGGGGIGLNSQPGTNNYYFGGVVLQKTINAKWVLGGELYGQQKSTNLVRGYTMINLGGYYSISKSTILLFSAGHNLAGQRSSIGYAGIAWNV